MTQFNVRVSGSRDLKTMAATAVRLDLANQLSPAIIEQLDPSGFNLLSIRTPDCRLDNRPGRYHQCEAILKMRGRDDPEIALIDIISRHWQKLLTVEETRRQFALLQDEIRKMELSPDELS